MNAIRHAAAALMLFLALTTLLCSESAAKERQGVPDAGKVGELFPEAPGTLSLREKLGARLAELGVELVNYEVMQGGKKLGEVTRILSLSREGLAARVDLLVRYDDRGAVQGVVSLQPWQEGQELTRLLWSFRGQDLRESSAALASMIAGVSAGTALTDGLAPPSPAGAYPVSVKQLLLEPGARLPALKVTDLTGRPFDSSLHQNSKLLISFLSPNSPRSGEMAQALERLTGPELRQKRVSLLQVISAPAGTADGYAKALGLNSPAAADPAGLLARMFQAPYTPYLFMFDRGVLTGSVGWEGEQRLQQQLREFLGGGLTRSQGGSK